MIRAIPDISYTDVTEVYLQELRRGNRVSIEALAKQFPQFASRLFAELPTMAALEKDPLSSPKRSQPIPRYELIEEIGRGASGVVYKARHESGKISAIKVIEFDPQFLNIARLDREIESLSRLRHPHIVSIESYDVRDDHAFIVMNLIEGIPLNALLDKDPSLKARFWISELRSDWKTLATWGLEIAAAMEYIHLKKVIHRDIKPSNLLVDSSGKCWVIDFGLAKSGPSEMTASNSEQVAGTPRYMAPEQLRGVVDTRCDIYSWGRTLYELCCVGIHRPHESAELLPIGQLNPNIPSELAKIIDKACDPHPDRRFQSATELVAVLERCIEEKSPCDRRRPGKRMTEQQFKSAMRRRVRYAIGVGIACFIATTAILVVPKFTTKNETHLVALQPIDEKSESLKKLVATIEKNDSGFVEVIGEAIKHSIVDTNENSEEIKDVHTKIDQIVQKVSNEGLKPGELDSIIQGYRNSPIMNANKIRALHPALHRSFLPESIKARGHATLELLAKSIINKHVQPDKADRILAALFQGEIPKLEHMVQIQIPDDVILSWLKLVESSFQVEFQNVLHEPNLSNQELQSIINDYVRQHP